VDQNRKAVDAGPEVTQRFPAGNLDDAGRNKQPSSLLSSKGEGTMRKVFESLDEDQRSALLWLTDLGITVFGSAIIVLVLKIAIDWL
jgi:hypothetical protein